MQSMAPTFTTERLTLRPIALDDFNKFAILLRYGRCVATGDYPSNCEQRANALGSWKLILVRSIRNVNWDGRSTRNTKVTDM
jgi:hypothetical protein